MPHGDPLTSTAAQAEALARAYQGRIRELEARLEENEDTLEAIRRGDVDAVVVGGHATGGPDQRRVYTLENADRPYRVLIEQIQEGAVTLDAAGTVLYGNRRLAEMLGTPQERVLGQVLHHYVLPDERGAFERLLAGARNGPVRSELTLCTARGEHLPIHLSLSPLQQDEGAALLCGVLTDLTQQRLHLRELAEANARLLAESAERERIEDALRQSQKMEAVGQLTGGIAHDFNNMLQAIGGSLDLLDRRLTQGRLADAPRLVEGARKTVTRAAALTHRLLAFARRQTLQPKPTDPDRLAGGMAELIRGTVGPGIPVRMNLRDGTWPVLCDPNQLESVLLNLAINARDAMPEGGQLLISTRHVHLSPADIAGHDAAEPGDYVEIAVADTGTGMDAATRARAFEPFFTTKPVGQGTGLGLSQLYGFAQQSNGLVHLDSAPGQGTTVRLYLPRHAGAEGPHQLSAIGTAPEQAGKGQTVLLVEDEDDVRASAGEFLRDLGYLVLDAADGPAALRLLRSAARPDVLVTDVGLPGGLNGRQLADAARERWPGLPVLFITGYAGPVLDSGLAPGMAVIGKPTALDALAARIEALLRTAPSPFLPGQPAPR